MGSTTQTPNLDLSQFADGDRPTWRGDYTSDMGKIDASIGTLTNNLNATNQNLSNATQGTPALIYVSPNGSDANSGKTLSLAKSSISAAMTAMGSSAGTIILAPGNHSLTGGFALAATAKCGLVGHGSGATTITITAQSGPALDFSAPGYNIQGSEIGGFTVIGDGVSNVANVGVKFSGTTSLVAGKVHDITVKNTGGPCFDLGISELSDFDRLTCYEPINASINNIPYLTAGNAFNGCRVNGLTINGVSSGANVGVDGAVVITSGSYGAHDNAFNNPRTENLHLPSNATIFNYCGNSSIISDPEFFDTNKIAGATGTSFIRLSAPANTTLDLGGNLIRGSIPGSQGSTTPDYGVDVRQSRNTIMGVKGYNGSNVLLGSGVTKTAVILNGSIASSTNPAVIDNSGKSSNIVVDSVNGIGVPNGTGNNAITSGSYYGPANHTPGVIAATQNVLYAIPVWLPSAVTISSLAAQVSVAGAAGTVCRLGAYTNNAVTNYPQSLIVDAGTIDATVVGVASVSVNATLPAGLVWLVACCQGGTASFTSVGAGTLAPVASASAFTGGMNSYYAQNVAGALPATFSLYNSFTGGIKTMFKAS